MFGPAGGNQKGANSAAEKAESVSRRNAAEVDLLTRRIERLVLVNAALWTLIQRHLPLREADLSAMVAELDAQDGKMDGRLGGPPRPCPACGKPVAARSQRCCVCGAECPISNEFEKV
jgi:hypothetical protein